MGGVNGEQMNDRDVEEIGEHLKGKNIALMLTGGIASYKSPSLVRHFRHFGANVQVYTTPEAFEYVTRKSLEWASLNPVISELTSEAEHLKNFDAYVIAPATYNTIGKIANGIADNAVTSTISSAIGKLENSKTKILVAPAMHGTMYNSFLRENLEKLVSKGFEIVEPQFKWDKANLADTHYIVVKTIREMSKSSLKGKRILITGGPTPGRIDNVRFITNKFKGKTALAIAEEAYLRGANVQLIMGNGTVESPKYLPTKKIFDYYEYYDSVMKFLSEEEFDIGIFSSAVADYIPTEVHPGKIPSQGALKEIPVKQTAKVIKEVREKFPELFMVTFKYEEKITKERLLEIADSRIKQEYNLVVANRGEDMGNKSHRSYIVDKTGIVAEPKTKEENAKMLMEILETKIK